MLLEAGLLMVVGMTVVFTFLVLLISATWLMSHLVSLFVDVPVATPATSEAVSEYTVKNKRQLAAMNAAIFHHNQP